MTNQTPESLLAEFLARKERGDAISFEAFVGEHPECADRLRSLYAGWELTHRALWDRHSRSLADRLRDQFGAGADPEVTLDAGAQDAIDSPLLSDLKGRGPASSRYTLKGELAQGGMGVVLRVWDRDLRRNLAMKMLLQEDGPKPTSAARLARFLEEAQVTGQLDHPNIVPIHELGIDDHGRVFFTMKLVQGETLAQVFEKVATGADGWNRTRALSVLLRVCDAMAFAHQKGVIHRDLKPANVMVGKFGETYVMDWGLARIVGRKANDVQTRPDATVSVVRTERRDTKGATPDSPLFTRDGDAVGTPAYMPPEQAVGNLEAVGPHSDVYAVGAILYHLLTGRMPFVDPGAHKSAREVLLLVAQGPPAPVHSLVHDAPAELEAICEKAMARKIEERYASMADLAEDLRAYLERRVVRAYETGPIAEMRKWIGRNRALAAAAALALVAIVAGLVGVAVKNVALADANVAVTEQKNVAVARKAEFDQLAGVVLLERGKRAADELGAAVPERIASMEHWLAEDARRVDELARAARSTIAALEARALPWSDQDRARDRAENPKTPLLDSMRRKAMALRRARSVRDGTAVVELPPLPAHLADAFAFTLYDFAKARSTPDETSRIYGEEPLALVAARAAVTKVDANDGGGLATSNAVETLAWSAFANGLDEEAIASASRLVKSAGSSARSRKEAAAFSDKVLDAIANAKGEAGLAELAAVEAEVTRLDALVDLRATWRFEKEEDSFLHDTLVRFVAEADEFARTQRADVEARLDWARRVAALDHRHPRARVTWDAARAAIMRADDLVASALYREHPIDLAPQSGLVPIGMNPVTKLWEFYELRSACESPTGEDLASIEIPVHRPDGSIDVKDGTGIVFVLIPGGTAWLGEQFEDPQRPNYVKKNEGVVGDVPIRVTLSPFLIARHELTIGQWKRLTGEGSALESRIGYVDASGDPGVGWTHPMTQLKWVDCERGLRRAGLRLPTCAQWEFAARAGTGDPWWTGNDEESLAGAANLLDKPAAKPAIQFNLPFMPPRRPEDGFNGIARVGQYRANPFGLFDVHGNASEWCADSSLSYYDAPPRAGDGLRTATTSGDDYRAERGGNAASTPGQATSGAVVFGHMSAARRYDGVRPARDLTTR